jgi:hypothetical protein
MNQVWEVEVRIAIAMSTVSLLREIREIDKITVIFI